MNFCSYFDRAHLTRGVLMARSLFRHRPDAHLTLLCFDDTVRSVISGLFGERIVLMDIGELERLDPALLEARSNRTFREYLSTVRPSLMLELLKGQPEGSTLHYLDADVYFFSDPAPLEVEFVSADVLLTPHDFAPNLLGFSRFGDFNAGWLSVKNGSGGCEVLAWWRERCLEWCKLVVEGDRFANQGYLNRMLAQFPQVRAARHRGLNVGPWNAANRQLGHDGQRFTAGAYPLLAYHFSTISRLAPGWFFTELYGYGALPRGLLGGIYQPYLDSFEQIHRQYPDLPLPGLEWPHGFRRRARRLLEVAVKLVRSDFIRAIPENAE